MTDLEHPDALVIDSDAPEAEGAARASLYCPDGDRGEFPPPQRPAPKERGAPWSPPDLSRDRCARCGQQAWQHWTLHPGAWP